MGIPDGLAASYRAKHPSLFLEEEDLTTIEAEAQGNRVSKKRRR